MSSDVGGFERFEDKGEGRGRKRHQPEMRIAKERRRFDLNKSAAELLDATHVEIWFDADTNRILFIGCSTPTEYSYKVSTTKNETHICAHKFLTQYASFPCGKYDVVEAKGGVVASKQEKI